MSDKLLEMEVFVRTADNGSLTAAASDLGMSAQMAGRYLKALEERLGVTLIVRQTRHQHLSEAGASFLASCRTILAAVHESEQNAKSRATRPAGRLRLTASVGYGTLVLAPRLAEFRCSFPDVMIDVRLTDAIVDLVAERIDLAFRIGELPDSSLIARALPDYELVAYRAPGYLAKPEQWAWIEYDFPGRMPNDISGDEIWRVRPVARAPALRFNDSRAAIAAVVAGAGTAFLPSVLVQKEVADGRLVSVHTDQPAIVRRMHLVYPARSLGSAARAFVDWYLQKTL